MQGTACAYTLACSCSRHSAWACGAWPQQRQGRGYVPLLTHDGRSYLLPVYRDDWLRLFWDCLFDADCAPLN